MPEIHQPFLDRLDTFLAGHGIEHFRAGELCPVGKRAWTDEGISDLQPAPESLWVNILPTLRVLEWLRDRLDTPIRVLSGYRDPTYNRAVGGAKNSLHVAFNACDIRVKGVDLDEIGRLLEEHPRAQKLGIGIYRARGFVHVDSRGMVGRKAPARWGDE